MYIKFILLVGIHFGYKEKGIFTKIKSLCTIVILKAALFEGIRQWIINSFFKLALTLGTRAKATLLILTIFKRIWVLAQNAAILLLLKLFD